MHPALQGRAPSADFHDFDTLWIQISGTLCNLRCSHCFISCSPENDSLALMETAEVLCYLEEARELGVKEIYFTGGEPFLHPDILLILEETLAHFPASVLTNGLPINRDRADRLAHMAASSPYTLELRISLDHYDPKRNDAVRGKGTFKRILAAYKRLYSRGFLPILTITEIDEYQNPDQRDIDPYDKYVRLLKQAGIAQPRVKIIPIFEMGMLPSPDRPQRVTPEMMQGFDHSLLQCSSSRIAAADGIYACPILVGEERARMSRTTLKEAAIPCSLYHTACTTCYVTGMTCKNY